MRDYPEGGKGYVTASGTGQSSEAELPRESTTPNPLEKSQSDRNPQNRANSTGLDEGYQKEQYWADDTGSLDMQARRALLQLVKGPYLAAERSKDLWQALLNNQEAIRSRLSELFLELVLDYDEGIAFARNPPAEEADIPKAVKSQPLTLSDTIMVLSLRRELVTDSSSRVIVGREETVEQLMHFRPVAQLDESAFKKRLEVSWSRFVKAGILQPLESEERCEISPVLRLIFGVEEVKGLQAEYEILLHQLGEAGNTAYHEHLNESSMDYPGQQNQEDTLEETEDEFE